jgi:putative peptidoglycan lipid II flippase
VEILARAFYSLHDTKTPVFVGILAMSLNVVFSYAFAALFERLGWMPHGGLALANSLATTLEMGALIYLMRRRLGGLKGRQVLSGLFQAVFAALLMSIALWLWMGVMNGYPDLVYVLGGVIIGGIVFALAAVMIRVPEALVMVKLIKNRL